MSKCLFGGAIVDTGNLRFFLIKFCQKHPYLHWDFKMSNPVFICIAWAKNIKNPEKFRKGDTNKCLLFVFV